MKITFHYSADDLARLVEEDADKRSLEAGMNSISTGRVDFYVAGKRVNLDFARIIVTSLDDDEPTRPTDEGRE